MSGPFGSAVVSEAVSRTTSFLTGKYSEHMNIHEWIERLLRVRIKFESVVKVSEGFDINIKSLREWQEKFKEDLCEAEEELSNFRFEIFHEKLNQTVEVGSSSHDQSMKEEGSEDTTLVHPASNLRETITRQVDIEANLPHDPFMQEERSDDATLVHPGSHLRETATRQVVQEPNLPDDQPMQEEGSDDATLVHPSSNIVEAVIRRIELEANSHPDPFMQQEGSAVATFLHLSKRMEALIGKVKKISASGVLNILFLIAKRLNRATMEMCDIPISLNTLRVLLGKCIENDEKVRKLIKTVEKLEKTAGDIGLFIEMLKEEKKQNMCRKRKRSARPHQSRGFFLVVALKFQTYGEDPHLSNYKPTGNIPTGITCEIFIGFIM